MYVQMMKVSQREFALGGTGFFTNPLEVYIILINPFPYVDAF